MNISDLEGSMPSYVSCYYFNRINSRGLPFGDDPLGYSLPSFLLQFSLISIVTRLLHFLLKPVGQPLIVAQILGGVILGPSVLGHNLSFFDNLYPRKSRLVLDTVSIIGFVLYIFLIGVKVDLSMVVRSGKKALVVGISGFLVSFGLAELAAFLLNKFLSLDHDVAIALPHIIDMLSMTAFPVITCYLDEFNILNSEIGRLASSSSVICDICFLCITFIKFATQMAKTSSSKAIIGSFFSSGLFIVIVIFVIRPAALWVIRNTPETRPVKEIYIHLAFIILMASVFVGEVIGIHATIASLFLGLIVPDGPPLGSTLVEILDYFVSLVLLPLFFTVSGLEMDVSCLRSFENFGVLQLVVFAAFVGKIVGSTLPLIVCRVPFRDAFSLGLIMNAKGIVELAILNDIKNREVITQEVYTIMIISLVAITGVISPIVKLLYDPSKRFVAYKRRTILHSRSNEELRVLACIHQQENVHSIISLLQLSNPTKDSPINLVVLHLVKLTGRASSLLLAHRQRHKPPRYPTQSERIFNAFKKFEEKNHGNILIHCYKGISPYTTMHNDVCSLALENRSILIILPFRKKWAFGEALEPSQSYRHLNKCVFEKAPCSVGVLIEHQIFEPFVGNERSILRVLVLFFGGADDREALAYAQRMSTHSSVRLSLVRFISLGPNGIVGGTARSKMLDDESLSNFKSKIRQNDEVKYEEKVVTSGKDVVFFMRSLVQHGYGLVLVGRRHGNSMIMQQLGKWKKRGELGEIGEILVATEFKGEASVLVVQQQTKLWGLKDPEESTHLRRISL